MNLKHSMERWTIEDSADLYQIREWGAGYFGISEKGDVVVTPLRDKSVSVSLPEIISGIVARGYDMPMLLRFEDILDSQITQLLSLIHISEPTRLLSISYAVFCLKKKKPYRIH